FGLLPLPLSIWNLECAGRAQRRQSKTERASCLVGKLRSASSVPLSISSTCGGLAWPGSLGQRPTPVGARSPPGRCRGDGRSSAARGHSGSQLAGGERSSGHSRVPCARSRRLPGHCHLPARQASTSPSSRNCKYGHPHVSATVCRFGSAVIRGRIYLVIYVCRLAYFCVSDDATTCRRAGVQSARRILSNRPPYA